MPLCGSKSDWVSEMSHLPNAYIVHRIPGRLRIKIPAARHQHSFLANLQQRLIAADGVIDVTVNAAAASITILHDRHIDPLADSGYVSEIVAAPAITRFHAQPCPHCGAGAGARTREGSGSDFDLVSIVAKLLPLVLPKHPLAQVAEIFAEPVLRALASQSTPPHLDERPALPRVGADRVLQLAA